MKENQVINVTKFHMIIEEEDNDFMLIAKWTLF